MREILFKAKRVDNGQWVEGCLSVLNDECMIAIGYRHHNELDNPHCMWVDVDKDTVSQYTGLKDKHGNKIFENDVLNAYGSYDLTIVWDNENAVFYAEFVGTKSGHEDDDNDDYAEACDFINYEVICSNFDNTELLTKE